MSINAPTSVTFADRADAGRQLGERLESYRGPDTVVVGLPRGGVPVAEQVARALDAPLDVLVVRKLGVPFQPELAMGAIGEGGVEVLDRSMMEAAHVTHSELRDIEDRERSRLQERLGRYRRSRPREPLAGRVVVVVDDGMATGSTARAACQVAREAGAGRVVLAVAVAAGEAVRAFDVADEVVTIAAPTPFVAVGRHYRDFAPASDDEVVAILERADRRHRQAVAAASAPDCDLEVQIPVGMGVIEGHLHLPEPAEGIVVLAHGGGSSRYSPRSRFVADRLYQAGLGTLLLDLLTPVEERHRANVVNIEQLARRLQRATDWLIDQPAARGARIGYFGSNTGAAAALWAAAEPDSPVAAVVSRGGRPDLARERLGDVQAPTLLIVGGRDHVVLDLNRQALGLLQAPAELAVVDRATHLFEEPGTLAEVTDLAADWFARYLLVEPEPIRDDAGEEVTM